MHPLLKGLAVLGISPLVMAAAGVVMAGAVIYGAGQVLVGVGDLLTGGPLKKTAKKAWQERRHRYGGGQGEQKYWYVALSLRSLGRLLTVRSFRIAYDLVTCFCSLRCVAGRCNGYPRHDWSLYYMCNPHLQPGITSQSASNKRVRLSEPRTTFWDARTTTSRVLSVLDVENEV